MPVAASISVARVGVLLVIVAIGPSGEAGRRRWPSAALRRAGGESITVRFECTRTSETGQLKSVSLRRSRAYARAPHGPVTGLGEVCSEGAALGAQTGDSAPSAKAVDPPPPAGMR